MSVPAAARMEASGVRRSCETESSRADFSASLRRDTSAEVASRVSRSRSSDPPIWSAAAARTLVSPGSGSPSARGRRPHNDPNFRSPAAMATRYAITSRSPLLAWAQPRCVHANPLGGFVPGAAAEHDVDGRRCRRTRIRGSVSAATVSPTTIQTRDIRVSSRTVAATARRASGASRSRGEGEADVEQRAGLALAGQRPRRTLALLTGETTDDRPEDQQQEQVQPLGRVTDGERVEGLDEQEVVQEERPDRGRDRRCRAGHHGDEHDREQVGRPTRSGSHPVPRGRRPRRTRRRARPRSCRSTNAIRRGSTLGRRSMSVMVGGQPPRTIRRASRLTRRKPLRWAHRPDVAGLAGVDGPDRDLGHRQAERDAAGDHLDLELEAGVRAVEHRGHQPPADQPVARLVVPDVPADRGREDPAAERVRDPPDRRHVAEVAPPDDELRTPVCERLEEERDLGRIVLAVGVEGDHSRGIRARARSGSRPGAPRPCPRSGAGRGRSRRRLRPGRRCRRSSRRQRRRPGGRHARASTTAPMRGPSW